MKTRHLVLTGAAVAAVVLAGCTTTQPTASHATQKRHAVNSDYVIAVERAARPRGVSVHWINAPTRDVASAQAPLDPGTD